MLDMATGSPLTPKGGDDDYDRQGTLKRTACGEKKKMKRTAGKYGYGPYAEEPWSMQSIQKRVYGNCSLTPECKIRNRANSGEVV